MKSSTYRAIYQLPMMTMSTKHLPNEPMPSSHDICDFLSDYGGWLLGSGATCIRMEKNISRIAEAYGKRTSLTITPHHVHISVLNPDDSTVTTAIADTKTSSVSFNIITHLSRLSWEIADKQITFSEARAKFRQITTSDRQNIATVLILASLANASFCRLFGGDGIAMLIAGIATFCGFYIKYRLTAIKTDIRISVFISAFVSTVIGATDYLFSLGTTPAVTIGTSILYLIPGVPFLNSFSDMLYRYYICSFSRFMDAMILTASLSAGLCAAMLLMNVDMF